MHVDDNVASESRPFVTLEQINEMNRNFWGNQTKLRDERLSDETIFKLATNDMLSEAMRQIPIKLQKSFEQALADAASVRNVTLSAFSRKGGKAYKTDALQRLVEEILEQEPHITERQLLRKLEKQDGEGVITRIDTNDQLLAGDVRMIHFEEENGTPKKSPVSGLKDRLSRAKKKILSR